MKPKLSFVLIVFFLLMILAQNVNAVPPFVTYPAQSLQIRTPGIDVYKAGENNTFPIHVFNSSGYYVTDATCFFHLYNSKNEHILISQNNSVSHMFDYEFFTNGSYLTPGSYFINYECNNSDSQGGVRYDFQVTTSGTIPTTAQGLIYAILILASMFFLTISLYGGFAINGENEFTMGGDLIRVNFNKYYKGFLFLVSYLFGIFTSYLAWQVSSQFLILDLGTAVFKTIFTILLIGFFPIIILLVIIGFVKWIADVELHKLAERNLKQR